MKALSILAALATAVQAVTLIVLHFLPTGYNPVRDAVSDYGVGRCRDWFWLQALAGGVGCLALGSPWPSCTRLPRPRWRWR